MCLSLCGAAKSCSVCATTRRRTPSVQRVGGGCLKGNCARGGGGCLVKVRVLVVSATCFGLHLRVASTVLRPRSTTFYGATYSLFAGTSCSATACLCECVRVCLVVRDATATMLRASREAGPSGDRASLARRERVLLASYRPSENVHPRPLAPKPSLGP